MEGHERTLDELKRTLNGHKTSLEERYTQKTKTKHVRGSKRPWKKIGRTWKTRGGNWKENQRELKGGENKLEIN